MRSAQLPKGASPQLVAMCAAAGHTKRRDRHPELRALAGQRGRGGLSLGCDQTAPRGARRETSGTFFFLLLDDKRHVGAYVQRIVIYSS